MSKSNKSNKARHSPSAESKHTENSEIFPDDHDSPWSPGEATVGKSLGGRSKGKFGLGSHFIFRKLLGEGSEGQTWLCEELATRDRVAVKVIPRQSDRPLQHKSVVRTKVEAMGGKSKRGTAAKEKKAKKFNPSRVAAEIIMQCALSHENLVKLTSVYMSATHLGLVMELVRGGELYGYIKKHPIPQRVLFPSWKEEKKGKHSLNFSKKKYKISMDDMYVLHKPPQDEKYRKHLDEERALFFFKQVLSGVSYCHRHHIAHRDLKLTNVLINTDSKPPQLKICDFGLSKHWIEAPPKHEKKKSASNGDSFDSLHDSVISDFEKQVDPNDPIDPIDEDLIFARCRTRVGSPMYVAREIVSRDFCIDGYDGTAVDVWSMGVMLYYMLRGKFPFPDFNGKGSMEILKRIPSRVKTDLLRNDLSKSELSDEARDLLYRMLRFDTSERIKMSEIWKHPWVARDLDEDKLQRMFAMEAKGERKHLEISLGASGQGGRVLANLFSKFTSLFMKTEEGGPKEEQNSSGHSTAIDSIDCGGARSDSTVAETSTSTIMDNGENGKTNVSGSKFPTDLWLEVKEMVYRASHTVGTQNERVEIWHPPFGPFRLTFCATKKGAKSVTT